MLVGSHRSANIPKLLLVSFWCVDIRHTMEAFMISIQPLRDHMHHIPALAAIWCEVLGKPWVPSITNDEVKRWMNSWHETGRMPLAHVALDNDEPVGVCALQKTDGIRPELSPWLTDLCVKKSHQGKSVGTQLVNATKAMAKTMGHPHLYLFTFDKKLVPYYERLGFGVVDHDRHRDLPVVVMQISF
jgi:GNAT superfamily N-acetyltransferase